MIFEIFLHSSYLRELIDRRFLKWNFWVMFDVKLEFYGKIYI